MKTAILAGGKGTRLGKRGESLPKALVEIGGKPIIWHIMMGYSHYGFKDFVIATGHRGEMIEQALSERRCFKRKGWSIIRADTGGDSRTGERIKRLAPFVGDRTFMLTWCDGLADIDLRQLVDFHRSHGRPATVTAVPFQSMFGHLTLQGDRVAGFREKPKMPDVWINGAFFVLEPAALDYIEGHDMSWESRPMENLAMDGQLMAYRHRSFWHSMDTLKDHAFLENMWQKKNPPWKVWS
ncbi:Glucose-1-phosphate cytidylyltransferase [Candidatus Desulfarcum epimagneticum]|uniref:Glucose-1-phosphate cytidylyltransferase n=1 Tax=uncultured Desulfobacteraceae bacterium TaxID=218296 RepID=A0A484HIK6_9BACT|nr:Glucose-1-phosphate cytidylyltransferase [uncultured Desulfobacteraceae bacterium]